MNLVGIITRFAARFMSAPRPDLIHLFPRGKYVLPIIAWATNIRDYGPSEECLINQVIHCKCKRGKEHEFLLVHALHQRSGRTVIMATDRSPESDLQAASKTERKSIISSNDVDAYDRVFLSYDGTEGTVTKDFEPFEKLQTLTFIYDLPTLLQFTVILTVVNHHAPQYSLYETQCFWFARSVWTLLKEVFPESAREDNPSKRASSYFGFPIPQRDSISSLILEYQKHWSSVMDEAVAKQKDRERQEEQVSLFGLLIVVLFVTCSR
jgi:hypothetical protein